MRRARKPSDAMMWVAVLTCCAINLLLAADWVGLIR